MKAGINQIKKILRLIPLLLLTGIAAMAQGPKVPDTMENPLAQILVIVMIFLALAIAMLANIVIGAADVFRQKMREERRKEKENTVSIPTLVLVPVLLLLSVSGFSQEAAAAATGSTSFNGLNAPAFYSMMAVVCLEILVILVLIYQLKRLLGIESKKSVKAVVAQQAPRLSWWDKLNRSIAIEKEKDIDLNHDYDGIRELDNAIPPWWIFGFVFFIVFGAGYLWRYHVAQSAPLQIEEYKLAMEKAEEEKAAYLAKAANTVDESNVTMLDATGLAAGKALFTQNCVACHGPEGQGASVGPNLSDAYWIHGGDIKDIFKTIKYGWPDKGMRSWKEDFSPAQLAQLASFVKSLKGTNPANPKEPQGELYTAHVADSSATIAK